MNSLTVRPTSLPSHGTSNPFLAAAHDTSSGIGKLLKFTKGAYQTGDNQVPLGTQFIAHVDQIARAWVKFTGAKLVDIKLFKVAEGLRLPSREELGDIDEALAYYGRLFRFELRGKSDSMAFIDLGDQFIALQQGRRQPADDGRHFGLVVDDKETARKALEAAGVTLLEGPFLDFRDPWGNRIEIVGYDNIQFTKAPNVLRGMGLMHLAKNEKAKKELAEKGMALE